ncbi:MAG TPA: ribosome maturation factor RimM [Lachnospiraceae bacterium]
MQEKFRIGVISNTHGLKGEVKVFPTTDDVTRFEVIEKMYIDAKEGEILVHPVSARYFKQFVIVKFKEMSNINEIEKYKGCDLLIDREDAIPLNEGEYYLADLYNLKVILEDGSDFGELTDIMRTGANDVYVVTRENGEEVLLPAIPDCILDVNLEKKVMTIHLMDGLL